MRHFGIVQLPILALLVSAALIYLVVTVGSLFAAVSVGSANTAPESSFHAVPIGDDGDYVYNWDFDGTSIEAATAGPGTAGGPTGLLFPCSSG